MIDTKLGEEDAPDFAGPDGIIAGARKIAVFLFGNDSATYVRRVYYAHEHYGLPIYRLCPRGPYLARALILNRWRHQQETNKHTAHGGAD